MSFVDVSATAATFFKTTGGQSLKTLTSNEGESN